MKVNGQLTGKGQIALVNQPNTFDKLNTFADITCTSLDVVSDENKKESIVTWLPGNLDQRLLGLNVCQFHYEGSRERQRLGLYVAEQCDIAIVDQNLSFPGAEVKGTDLIKEILAAGYGGLACVRSANCTDADQREYLECGAHCTIDKDMRWREMAQLLANAYANHVRRPHTGTLALSDVSDERVLCEWNVPGAVNV